MYIINYFEDFFPPKYLNVVLHNIFTFANAFWVLFHCQFLSSAFKTEKAFDVQLSFLLETGPVCVLGMNTVQANLVDNDPKKKFVI